VLEIERFSYWYPSLSPIAGSSSAGAALNNVSLSFEVGEFVVVIGPSGSGKSTFIQALLGVVPALTGGTVTGAVRFAGEPVLGSGLSAMAGKIGLVLQDPESQLTNLDVEGEVVFGPENLCLTRSEIGQRLEDALGVTGIRELRHRFVYALSGGQKQRVALAAGLAMRPRALLLDSPTSNLDPTGSEETLSAILGLWQAGATELIVMAAHKIDEVLPFATRLVVLDEGRVAFDGPPREVLGNNLAVLRDELGVFVPQVCELSVGAGRSGAGVAISVEETAALLRTHAAPPAPKPHSGRAVRESVVEVRDLHFAYEAALPVLSGVSLTIGRGEFLALLGRNGAGKTTLAKTIAGLYRPSRGSIRIGGVDVVDPTIHVRTGRVGYVFQYPDHQFVALTVADELAYGLRARNMPEPEIRARVEPMLEMFELSNRRDVTPYSLSMGEKRRLSVATMLVLEPEVLILDEPTTGQDRHNTIALMRLLRRAASEHGTTIVQITHDMEQAAEYADRLVVIDDGRVAFDGSVYELFADADLLQRCHLIPTQTSLVSRQVWPELTHVPVLPSELLAGLRSATVADMAAAS
jgi:energy-coupling factor transport system ATP-binding protein